MASYGAIGDRRSSSGTSSLVGGDSPTTPSLSIAAKAAFCSFGIVTLIPWNAALIIGLPYLLDRQDGSPSQSNLGSWLGISYNASGLIALAIATWLADKLRPTPSIILSICLSASALFVLAIVSLQSISTTSQLAAALTGSIILASSTAFFRTPAIAIATAFGPEAITAYFSGTALVGVLISAGACVVACVSSAEGVHYEKSSMVIALALSIGVCLLPLAAYHSHIRPTQVFTANFKPRTKFTRAESDWLVQAQLRMVLAQGEGVWATTKRNLGYNMAQCWVFAVTLAVYPAITIRVVPASYSVSWTPLVFHAFHFLVFNLGDLAGRLLVSFHKRPISSTILLIHCLLQTLFGPLFLLCNFSHPASSTPITGPSTIIPSLPTIKVPSLGDIQFLVLLFLFALNCGYTSSLGFIAVGSKKGARARTGARVLQLWMLVGTVLGSVAGWGVGMWRGW
ncbi:hypothetical protein FRC12_018408 [Ceratobasidium sp. 428]|nr:hypothetical protein FRC12_018408 [Ceratobasidium sp. 428]